MPELDQNTLNAARTVNQFISLAGTENALKVSNDGRVSTRNSLWNKIITLIRGQSTERNNRRTAEIFKEKLLTVARTYEYKTGSDVYHPNDIFHHFAGFETAQRAAAVEAVLNSGILNEELQHGRPLTGRKVQEVLAQIHSASIDHARTQREALFSQLERGVGLYREARHQFQQCYFNPQKLEASNLDSFQIAERDLSNVLFKLDGLIANTRQDLTQILENPDLNDEDMALARHLFRQIQHASDLKSEAALFNTEKRAYEGIDAYANPLMARYEAAIKHLDAITFNFTNLNEEQIRARDELGEIHRALGRPIELLGSTLSSVRRQLDKGELHSSEQIKKWEGLQKFTEEKLEELKEMRAKAANALITKTNPITGAVKSKEPRNEETHIAPSAVITREELGRLEEEINRLDQARKNPNAPKPATPKGILKKVSAESINQIKHGKKVHTSSTLEIIRGEIEGAKEVRKSVPKSRDNDDLSELDEADDQFGVHDPATNTLRHDTFSNLAKSSRLSNIKVGSEKVAAANESLQAYQRHQTLLSEVQNFVNKYSFDGAAIKAFALENNIDLSKLSPSQQELYKTILSYEFKAIATDSPQIFNDEELQKIAKKFFVQVATRGDAAAQASLARFKDLNEAGKTLLASISNESISGLSDRRQALGDAIISYLKKINSPEIISDLIVQAPGERFGSHEVGVANIAAADIAFSGIRGDTLDLLFQDALKEGSPLRLAYLAAGAQDKNPAVNGNDSLNAALIDLTQGLNFVVQQLGQNAGLSDQTVGSAIRSFSENFSDGNFQDFTNPDATTVPPQAREIFDTFTPFLQVRAEFIRNTAQNFDA